MIRAAIRDFSNHIGILFKEERPDGIYHGRPIVLERAVENTLAVPTATISIQEGQVLMDDLWNAGIRPTEGTGSAGGLKATQNHLEDMRTLVFDKEK